MTQHHYQDALLRLYCEQPDTPRAPSRADWAIAADLYRQGIPFASIAHAIRVATLRRLKREPDAEPLRPILSLAYYRRVLACLTPDDFDQGYVGYVEQIHAQALEQLTTPTTSEHAEARPDSRNTATGDRR
jgi:hypothetical protein